MQDDIDFIRLITQAYISHDGRSALRAALSDIMQKRAEPGYRQFCQFMQVVTRTAEKDIDTLKQHRAIELLPEREEIEIIVKRGVEQVGQIRMTGSHQTGQIGQLMPGDYQLLLATGRLIWQGHLPESDLLHRAAYPDRPLALAAATHEMHPQPTRNLSLLGGALEVSVYAGIEFGSLVIERK